MITPLGALLSTTLSRCRERSQPFLIGVLLFGTLVAIVSTVSSRRIEGQIWQGMQRIGIDQNRMVELQTKLQSGDEDAIQNAALEMETVMEGIDGMPEEERNALFRREGMMMMFQVLPVLGFGLFAWALISLLSSTYFLLFGIGKGKDAVEILSNGLRVIFPLLGVWIWSFLRSFAWIPFIGFIPAVILGPRFALAPVILVTQHKGVTESVSESYRMTTGFWCKIVGNLIVVGLILMAINWATGLITIPIAMGSRVLSIWIHSVVQQGAMAYGVVFFVLLTQAIVEQTQAAPQKTTKKGV